MSLWLSFRTLPSAFMEKIVETISKFSISALLVIGGFEVQVVVYKGEQSTRSTLFPLGQLFVLKVVPSIFQIRPMDKANLGKHFSA